MRLVDQMLIEAKKARYNNQNYINPFAILLFWITPHPKKIPLKMKDEPAFLRVEEKRASQEKLISKIETLRSNKLLQAIPLYLISDKEKSYIPQELEGVLGKFTKYIPYTKLGSFEATTLSEDLIKQEAKELILLGYGGSTWILKTAHTALERGYRIISLEDTLLDVTSSKAGKIISESREWYMGKGDRTGQRVTYRIDQLIQHYKKITSSDSG